MKSEPVDQHENDDCRYSHSEDAESENGLGDDLPCERLESGGQLEIVSFDQAECQLKVGGVGRSGMGFRELGERSGCDGRVGVDVADFCVELGGSGDDDAAGRQKERNEKANGQVEDREGAMGLPPALFEQ